MATVEVQSPRVALAVNTKEVLLTEIQQVEAPPSLEAAMEELKAEEKKDEGGETEITDATETKKAAEPLETEDVDALEEKAQEVLVTPIVAEEQAEVEVAAEAMEGTVGGEEVPASEDIDLEKKLVIKEGCNEGPAEKTQTLA